MSATGGKRIRRSAENWRVIFDQQRASGLSQAAFCAHEGIALSTFARWKQRLAGETEAEPASNGHGGDGWIDLSRLAGTGSGWTIELDLGDGICLRLARG